MQTNLPVKHKTFTGNRIPYTRRFSNPQSQQAPSHSLFTNHSTVRTHTKANAAVPEFTARTYKCEKCSFLPLGTLVPLSLSQSSEFCRHNCQRCFPFGLDCCGCEVLSFRICKIAWETQEMFETFSLTVTWGEHRILSGFSLFISGRRSVE